MYFAYLLKTLGNERRGPYIFIFKDEMELAENNAYGVLTVSSAFINPLSHEINCV